jgi:hypothetical protein
MCGPLNLFIIFQDDFTGSSHSAMDTEMVNMYKYEKAGTMPWEWATIRPGDCVFVPAGKKRHRNLITFGFGNNSRSRLPS